MRKKDIARMVAERLGITIVDDEQVVQGLIDAIIDGLVSDGNVEFRNFGVFNVVQRRARKARNPRTGEEVDVPAKKKVTFVPGRIMRVKVK